MSQEQGTIVDVQADQAWVAVERRSTCESCAVQKGCGTSVLSKVVGKKIATIKVDNVLNARVGDQVTIIVNDNALVSGALALYGLPLLAMFALASLAHLVFNYEVLTMLAALAGLALSFFILHLVSKKSAVKNRFQAKMQAIEQKQVSHFPIKLLS